MPVIYDTGSGATTRAPKRKKKPKTPKVRVPKAPDRQPAPKPKFKTPDQADRDRERVAAGRSPDQADRARPPATKQHDAKVVAKNIRTAKAKPRLPAYAARGRDGKIRITDPEAFKEAGRKSTAGAYAPVLRVLDETTRVNHAIAGGADAAVTGKDISRAALKGIKNETRTTFSDVLGHAGVKNKAVRGVGGFALDVATDPTTYVTFGVGSVASKSAAKGAAAAEKKALAKGLTEQQAKKFGERAARKAEKHGDQAKGVTVKLAGKELPGVRTATAKAGKPVRAAGRKATPGRVREGVRAVGSDLNPDVVPVGVARETSRKAVQATRTARSKSNRGVHDAQQHALGIQDLGAANYSRIIDAIENGTIAQLPEELRAAAIRIRSQFRHANRQRKQAGIRGGEIKRRGQVKVPEVTADTNASAKAVGRARRAEATARRDADTARQVHDIHQGRAEVLSRNVSGSRAEKAAERGRRKRKVNRPARVMYHVVRDSAVSKDTKLKGIRAEGIKPSSNGHVFLYDNLAQAKEFSRGNGHILEVNVDGLTVEGGEGAATRSVRGKIPKGRVRAYREGARPPRYAGGGHGVQQTATALRDIEQRVANTAKARKAAEAAHDTVKAKAAAQRAARKLAEETNAKRAAAPVEYIPHNLTDEALEAKRKEAEQARGAGRKVIRPPSSMGRGDNRPLSVLRQEKPGIYSEDLPTLYAARKIEGATSVARAELNRRIADLGSSVRKGDELEHLPTGESVYHITGSDIRAVTDKKELARLTETGSHSGPMRGRYVVLNDDIVKRAIEGVTTPERTAIGAGYDKVQGGFKRIALATPGFHTRNFVGDTHNVYGGQPGHRIPKNMVDAGRILKAEGRRDKALRSLTPGETGEGTIRTGRYGDVTYDQAAEQLGKHGAMRSGYMGRELPELAGEKATAGRIRLPRKAKQAFLNREDLPRLTTAVDALKNGATWEEAAQKVADQHFDYSHLTRFERTAARRFAPFYTFTARNIPLQTKTLITKPGKFANYEKLREEAAKAVGMDEEAKKHRDLTDQLRKAGVKLPKGWERNLSEWEQRNASVPVRWKGSTFTVSMGLPLIDLNEFPGAALGNQIDEYYQKTMSLGGPLPKDIIEYMENHSFFFRDPIEREGSRLVAAPGWVKNLPPGLKKKMGVTENWIDKKTGKKGLAYRAKADYVIKSVPGTPAFLNKMATDGHDRVGKGKVGKTLSYFGVKATPYDPVQNAVNLAMERKAEIDLQLGDLAQQVNPKNGVKISAKNPTPEYVKLLLQRKAAESIAYQGRQQQGYKVLPATGGPPKNRGSNGRVRIPGVSGRVKVPGVGGRIKIP